MGEKNINSYNIAMLLPQISNKECMEIIKVLKNLNIAEISEQRIIVAQLFCKLLQKIQRDYEKEVPGELEKEILIIFENIERIGNEATEEEQGHSAVKIIWFLKELKEKGANNKLLNIDNERMIQSVEILIDILDSIKFIFNIYKDNVEVFPISKMISKVISNQRFMSADKLNTDQIHILQLAVKLFERNSEEQKLLKKLREECNLRFITYLEKNGKIIDSKDFLNYRYNNVMIFVDLIDNKVLIRSDKKYFESKILEEQVEYEKDYDKNVIGAYVEYNLEKEDCLISYSDVLKDERGRQEFLKLVFQQGYTNILLEESIVRKADNSLVPLNQYCAKDKNIIKGKQDKRGEKYDMIDYAEALRSYLILPLKSKILNRVSFGLGLTLLLKENNFDLYTSISKLDDGKWYQDQILELWIKNSHNPKKNLLWLIGQWNKEMEYCQREAELEMHTVSPQIFYPVKSNSLWVYKFLWKDYDINSGIFYGIYDESERVININLNKTYSGRDYRKNKEKNLEVKVDKIKNWRDIYDENYGSDKGYYIIYNYSQDRGITIEEQDILKGISAIENLHMLLDFNVAKQVKNNQYMEIYDIFKLYEKTIKRKYENIFGNDFEGQFFIRLIHNMIWSGITEKNWEQYYKIMRQHQKLEFKDIQDDEYFLLNNKSALYVPKDSSKAESTLGDIYSQYIQDSSSRNNIIICCEEIGLCKQNDKYYRNKEEIKEIILLVDNFENGGGTKITLSAYLNIQGKNSWEQKRIDAAKRKIQKYYYTIDTEMDKKEQRILLSDILESGAKLSVHGYYGTDNGANAIDKFLEENNIKHSPTTYHKQIYRKIKDLLQEAKQIWMSKNDYEKEIYQTAYAVFREFNMTKVNVFPNKMLENSDLIICMFPKKKEKDLRFL